MVKVSIPKSDSLPPAPKGVQMPRKLMSLLKPPEVRKRKWAYGRGTHTEVTSDNLGSPVEICLLPLHWPACRR
ncbi:MAG: hypothetical protein AW09_000683 [Candidatus Accumulibacter phosphatis]|uniref:Uncharacterized protein n=1 Tax=Candidatus Accumulibacter phosphatis TaxID=327160 RepID=A0A080LYT6_9PROT|nr:MAG: hypothetical protein AW09_000683 [Candidatus Accumulibacter phosphatis]